MTECLSPNYIHASRQNKIPRLSHNIRHTLASQCKAFALLTFSKIVFHSPNPQSLQNNTQHLKQSSKAEINSTGEQITTSPFNLSIS